MALTKQTRWAVPGVGRPWIRSQLPGPKGMAWRSAVGLTIMGEFDPDDTDGTVPRDPLPADTIVGRTSVTDTNVGRIAGTDGTVGRV